MKLYLASLAVGVLVGVIYGLLDVRSPAPPVIALVGLAGILLGEQLVPLARQLIGKTPVAISSSASDPYSKRLAALQAKYAFADRAPLRDRS